MWSLNKDHSTATFVGQREAIGGDGSVHLLDYRLQLIRISRSRYACQNPTNPVPSHPALELLRDSGINFKTVQEENKWRQSLGLYRDQVTILEFAEADLVLFRLLCSD